MIEKLEAIIKGVLGRNFLFKLKPMIKNLLPLCPSALFPQSTTAAAPCNFISFPQRQVMLCLICHKNEHNFRSFWLLFLYELMLNFKGKKDGTAFE